MGSGAYITIDNISEPQGNLFEGITMFALGTILLVLMTAIAYLVKVVTIFSEIYSKQNEMQQEMTAFYTKSLIANRPKGIGDFLGAMGGNQNSISVTNMETGETTSAPLTDDDSIKNVNEIISKILGGNPLSSFSSAPTKKLEDMTVEQLEKELAKAVKQDQFEKANEIKGLIHKKRNPDS